MSLYIQIADLKAQTSVAKDIYTVNPLQDYLDKFEVIYLQDLMGCDLYNAFAADFAILGNAPTDPKFVEIWEPICMDNKPGIIRTDGIKAMLALFIYCEWLRDQETKNNISGPQKNVQANSEAASMAETNFYTNYNEAIESYCNIQLTICKNPNNYDWTLYNGQTKEFNSFI